jgi:hypothetical protein
MRDKEGPPQTMKWMPVEDDGSIAAGAIARF